MVVATILAESLTFAPSAQVEALYDTALSPGFAEGVHKLAAALKSAAEAEGSTREGEAADAVYSAVEFLADEYGIRVAA